MNDIEKAIQALEEKQERAKGCEYCDCDSPQDLFNNRNDLSSKGDFYPGVQICVDSDNSNLEIDYVADTYESSYGEAEFKINYCPFCGRKLR